MRAHGDGARQTVLSFESRIPHAAQPRGAHRLLRGNERGLRPERSAHRAPPGDRGRGHRDDDRLLLLGFEGRPHVRRPDLDARRDRGAAVASDEGGSCRRRRLLDPARPRGRLREQNGLGRGSVRAAAQVQPVRSLPLEVDDRGRHRARRRRLRERGKARRAHRFRRHRAPCRARLPAQPVPEPAHEHADRSLRRLARKPREVPTRGARGDEGRGDGSPVPHRLARTTSETPSRPWKQAHTTTSPKTTSRG